MLPTEFGNEISYASSGIKVKEKSLQFVANNVLCAMMLWM